MSPDSDVIKWIALGLALAQTAAALLQLALVKEVRPGRSPTSLDRSVRLGLTLLPAAVVVFALAPRVPPTAEQLAAEAMEAVAIIVIGFGPGYIGMVMGYNGAALLRPDVSAGNAVANAAALGAGALLVVVCYEAMPPMDGTWVLAMPFVITGVGFYFGVDAFRTANREAETDDTA